MTDRSHSQKVLNFKAFWLWLSKVDCERTYRNSIHHDGAICQATRKSLKVRDLYYFRKPLAFFCSFAGKFQREVGLGEHSFQSFRPLDAHQRRSVC